MAVQGARTITRQNQIGLTYTLCEPKPGEVLVRLGTKSLTFRGCDLERVNQSWYNWQMRGMFIQDAFAWLDADEREFLKTGITPDEWKATFGEEEK